MTPLRESPTSIGLEVVSVAALVVVVLPALAGSGITRPGVAVLTGVVVLTHLIGIRRGLHGAGTIAVLAAAGLWLLVHAQDERQARGAVIAGLLLLVAEETRELSLTVRRPGVPARPTVMAWLPRLFGVAAAALAADAAITWLLAEPISSGWIWRVVGVGGLLALVAATRPRATGS